jgi:hypothetical protein
VVLTSTGERLIGSNLRSRWLIVSFETLAEGSAAPGRCW